jgi:hypothetical protein
MQRISILLFAVMGILPVGSKTGVQCSITSAINLFRRCFSGHIDPLLWISAISHCKLVPKNGVRIEFKIYYIVCIDSVKYKGEAPRSKRKVSTT